MSFNKKHVNDPEIVKLVLATYRGTELTQAKVAEVCGVSHGSVVEILNRELDLVELKKLKSVRYRNSKLGKKNPALGKRPPNYLGDFDDGKGYKKRYVESVQQFVHRIVVADAIGIPVEELPSDLEVHHIDRNPLNNNLANLALVSKPAHKKIHGQLRELDRLRKLQVDLNEPTNGGTLERPVTDTVEKRTLPVSVTVRKRTRPVPSTVRKRTRPEISQSPEVITYPPVRKRTMPAHLLPQSEQQEPV